MSEFSAEDSYYYIRLYLESLNIKCTEENIPKELKYDNNNKKVYVTAIKSW